MTPIITLEHLCKQYDVPLKDPGLSGAFKAFFNRKYRCVKAVDDISFAINPGEIVGFLGPNGAGKTTTLKVLSGLLYPTSGTASVLGFTPQKRQRDFLTSITLVMGQKQQLAWDLTPLDSFLVNQAIYDIDESDYKRRVEELVEMLDLQEVLDKPVRRLSLGERMKCELAAALLHQPKILFLDEPTIGLDVNAQLAVRRFIADYNRRFGATVILTSHYMGDVEALAERVIIIDRGKLKFDGDLTAMMARHAPHKRLKLVLSNEVSMDRLRTLPGFLTSDGLQVELSAERAGIAKLAAHLLADLPVADIAIEEPPIEDVLGELFGRTEVPAQ